jgi:hypothetical protein
MHPADASRQLRISAFRLLVRGAGLEPARYFYHEPLKLACLPFHHPRIKELKTTLETVEQGGQIGGRA